MIFRKTYYKQLSTLIDEALRQGHSVVCIHELSEPSDSPKAYDRPDFENAPCFQHGTPERVEIHSTAQLTSVVAQEKLNILVTLGFTEEHAALRRTFATVPAFHTWAVIQHAVDDLVAPLPLLGADAVFLYSEKWREWLLDMFEKKGGNRTNRDRLNQKIHCLGAPQIDQYARIDRDKVRADWRIPTQKKVVVVLPFAFGSSLDRRWSGYIFGETRRWVALLAGLVLCRPRWVYQAWQRLNNRSVMSSLRAFCDKNNAWLLIKARQKDPLPAYARECADQILYDEEFYPATILKCFAIADLCVHFNSTAVVEAGGAGVPSLGILPDACDFVDFRSPVLRDVYRCLEPLFNFPGVSRCMTIPTAIQNLPLSNLAQFQADPEEYRVFDQSFVGSGDRQTAGRIINALRARNTTEPINLC